MKLASILLLLLICLPVFACKPIEFRESIEEEENKQLFKNLNINPSTIREFKYSGYLPNRMLSFTIVFKPNINSLIYTFFKVTCEVNTKTIKWKCQQKLLTGFNIEETYAYTDQKIPINDLKKLHKSLITSLQNKKNLEKDIYFSSGRDSFYISENSGQLKLHEESCHGVWFLFKKKYKQKKYYYFLADVNKFISL